MATYVIGNLNIPFEARGIMEDINLSSFDSLIPDQTIEAGKVSILPGATSGTLTEDITVNLNNRLSPTQNKITFRAGYPIRVEGNIVTITILKTHVHLIGKVVAVGGRRRTYRRKAKKRQALKKSRRN
jgi:hypothetical protein